MMHHAPPLTSHVRPWAPTHLLAVFVTLIVTACATAQEISPEVAAAEAERIEVMSRVTPAVVAVFGPDGGGGGSGVLISADGFALSNFHVTSAAGDWMKCGLPDGNVYDAVIVGIDPTGDVALLKLLGRDDFPVAQLGDSDRVRVGEWVFAMGNPFLLAADFQPTVSYGIVSGVQRYQYPAGTILEYTDCIQTDAAINPGNSGGPLFNAAGELIGINGRGSFEKRGRVNVGVGYAISINQIKNFIGALRAGRIVDHATLGATVRTDSAGRVLIADILSNSDAFQAGLRTGDELISFGGRPIRTVNAFKNVLGIFPEGWRVPLVYRRDGQREQIFVRLASVHGRAELLAKIGGMVPEDPTPPPELPNQPESEPAPEAPPQPLPPQMDPRRKAKAQMPEHVKQLFEQRRGYANYHFNRLEQQRVWTAAQAHGELSELTGAWLLAGIDDSGDPFSVRMDGRSVVSELNQQTDTLLIGDDLAAELLPSGSGGLLTALHLWRGMLIGGPTALGQVSYLGHLPLDPGAPTYDVLEAVVGGVQALFFFDQTEGHLAAIEMYPATDAAPARLRLSEYRAIDGHMLPGRIEVHNGREPFIALLLETADLQPAGELSP